MPEPITPDTRHFTASAVVLDPARGKALLIAHRAEGRVQFPGGHIDPNERPHIAALREVVEETGVHGTVVSTVASNAIPGSLTFPTPVLVAERRAPAKPHKGEPIHWHIDFLYVIVADSTDPVRNQPEENEFAVWVDYAEITDRITPGLRNDVPAQLAYALQFLNAVPDA